MTDTPRLLAITRDISPAIEQCELTHLERTAIDVTRARAEHEVYESVLRDLGCQVQRLPAGPDMADSVFIEDAALVLDELAVITRPGAASRRAETAAVAEAVRRHRPVAAILAPGTLDGGDVVRIGKRLFVGGGYSRLQEKQNTTSFLNQGNLEFGGGFNLWLTDGVGLRLEARDIMWITDQNSATNPRIMIVETSVLEKNIPSEPWDPSNDCRNASSALSPSTMASTSGARG